MEGEVLAEARLGEDEVGVGADEAVEGEAGLDAGEGPAFAAEALVDASDERGQVVEAASAGLECPGLVGGVGADAVSGDHWCSSPFAWRHPQAGHGSRPRTTAAET